MIKMANIKTSTPYINDLPTDIISLVLGKITNIYEIEALFRIFKDDFVYRSIIIIDMIQTNGEHLSYDEYKRLFPIVEKCTRLHHYNLHLNLILNESDITDSMVYEYVYEDLQDYDHMKEYITMRGYDDTIYSWIIDQLKSVLTNETSDKLMNYRIITNSTDYITGDEDFLVDKLVSTYLKFKPDFCVVEPFIYYENGVIVYYTLVLDEEGSPYDANGKPYNENYEKLRIVSKTIKNQ
jgi:hypothetical protein